MKSHSHNEPRLGQGHATPSPKMPLPKKPLPDKPFPKAAVIVPLWIILLIVATAYLDISFQTLLYGGEDMAEYLSRYGTPDFSQFSTYMKLMIDTLATALWGTIIAMVIGFFTAPLAASNLCPWPVVYRVTREILNVFRALPDLLLALIFVAGFGLGPLPGALALGIHTAGFLGKFLAENFERIDARTIDALKVSGASPSQVIVYAGWPSILREAVGYCLYLVDRNVRMASVLGLVGAGGIGLALHETLRLFKYDQSAGLIIVILGTIVAVDFLSSLLRARLA